MKVAEFSKRVENTVEKGEIDRHEQFLLFHSVFKRLEMQTHNNQGLFWKALSKFAGKQFVTIFNRYEPCFVKGCFIGYKITKCQTGEVSDFVIWVKLNASMKSIDPI